MNRKVFGFHSSVLAIVLAIALTACGATPADEVPDMDSSESGALKSTAEDSSPEDLFAFGEGTTILGSLQHNPAGYNASDLLSLADNPIVIDYTGAECSLEYQVTASGSAKDVGFLLLLDNEPIPYKTGNTDADYEYCHTFHLSEDNEPYVFTIYFTPVGGVAGETKPLKLASVYNPEYHPDMVETSNYGSYHDITAGLDLYRVVYQADAPDANNLPIGPISCIENPVEQDSVITSELLAVDWIYGGPIDEDTLDTTVRQQLIIDGSESPLANGNYDCANQDSVHITQYLYGVPGMTYKTTFYLNHQPICDENGHSTFTVTLQKGTVHTIEFDLPVSAFGDGVTFYALSLPCNSSDFPDLAVDTALRTPSVYLYQ